MHFPHNLLCIINICSLSQLESAYRGAKLNGCSAPCSGMLPDMAAPDPPADSGSLAGAEAGEREADRGGVAGLGSGSKGLHGTRASPLCVGQGYGLWLGLG